jgi:hypothetical protein
MLDADRSLESVMECRINAADPTIRIQLRRHSVALVKLT